MDIQDPQALTPFMGVRNFSTKDLELFTPHLDEAFQRVTDELPEEGFYFLNIQNLQKRVQLLQKMFLSEAEGRRIAYAVKANPQRKILEILHQAGVNSFDCASMGEIEEVLSTVDEKKVEVLFNHPIKKERDIRNAVRMGVRHFTVQTRREIEKVLLNCESIRPDELEIVVRLDTPTQHDGINLSEKFGASTEDVRSMIRMIKALGANPGLSIHTGSQNTDPGIFVEGISKMMDMAREVGGVSTINIGGGLPANIHQHDRFDLEHYLGAISNAIRASIEGVFSGLPNIIIEPGRGMVAEAADALIPILSVEERRGEKVMYIDDGIFTSFSDLIIHRWKYPFRGWKKNGAPLSDSRIPYRVFGRTCDSGDALGIIDLPEDLQEGDYLHIPTAGAYLSSQSSEFNGFKPHRYAYYNH